MAAMTATAPNGDIRVSNREEDSMNNEPSLSGKTIVGLIIPPPDIRNIVDKTALFVARNGIDFENKIKEKEATNSRFNFLSPTDPYHAYYKNKVVEFETGVATAPSTTAAEAAAVARLPDAVREHMERVEFVPKNPPRPNEFTADPSTINAFDLDLIRLTALFVARNGRQFLTQLMNREARNYQFDFLKPQHSNFSYFTKLVEQYTKILIPAKNVIDELKETSAHSKILADVQYRVGWEKFQRNIKDKEEAEVERERLAYNQIDWHDFVVVQTVDLQPSETLNLPPLCTPKDVGARILLQQRSEAAKAASETVAMDMDSESEEEPEDGEEAAFALQDKLHVKDGPAVPLRSAHEVTQPMPGGPTPANVVIRDYDPKKARSMLPKKALTEEYIVSPLTGERIPAHKLQEHVRFNTVDPQYKEQRDREQMERQDDDPTSASGTEISRNIAKLAERRTDIFGVGEQGAQQTIIGKKLGEEENVMPRSDSKTIWDGQQSTIDATTRAAQQAITLDQQIIEIQRQHGYQPDPSRERIGPKDGGSAAPPIPAPPMPMGAPPAGGSGLPPAMPSKPTLGSNVARIIPVPIKPPIPTAVIPPQPMGIATPMPGGGGPPIGMPPMAMMGGGAGGFMPPPPPSGYDDGGPPSKRARPEETLESEEQWLQKVSGTVNLSVATPATSEWNLNGKSVPVAIDINTLVSAVKAQLQEQTGVPTSKQKLVHEGIFMKDNFSLAYYNVSNHSVLQLQIKERGGRKK